MSPTPDDRIVWRAELQRLTGKSSDTIRRWIKDGRLPAPSVSINRQTLGWKLSALRQAGLEVA